MQCMFAKAEGISLLDSQRPSLHIDIIELRNQTESLFIPHQRQLGMDPQKLPDRGAVIRFHMVDHKIIQLSATQSMLHILNKLARDGGVHGVHYRRLFIQNDIGIIGNPIRNGEQVFKQGQPAVVSAHPNDIFCDFSRAIHALFLPFHMDLFSQKAGISMHPAGISPFFLAVISRPI